MKVELGVEEKLRNIINWKSTNVTYYPNLLCITYDTSKYTQPRLMADTNASLPTSNTVIKRQIEGVLARKPRYSVFKISTGSHAYALVLDSKHQKSYLLDGRTGQQTQNDLYNDKSEKFLSAIKTIIPDDYQAPTKILNNVTQAYNSCSSYPLLISSLLEDQKISFDDKGQFNGKNEAYGTDHPTIHQKYEVGQTKKLLSQRGRELFCSIEAKQLVKTLKDQNYKVVSFDFDCTLTKLHTFLNNKGENTTENKNQFGSIEAFKKAHKNDKSELDLESLKTLNDIFIDFEFTKALFDELKNQKITVVINTRQYAEAITELFGKVGLKANAIIGRDKTLSGNNLTEEDNKKDTKNEREGLKAANLTKLFHKQKAIHFDDDEREIKEFNKPNLHGAHLPYPTKDEEKNVLNGTNQKFGISAENLDGIVNEVEKIIPERWLTVTEDMQPVGDIQRQNQLMLDDGYERPFPTHSSNILEGMNLGKYQDQTFDYESENCGKQVGVRTKKDNVSVTTAYLNSGAEIEAICGIGQNKIFTIYKNDTQNDTTAIVNNFKYRFNAEEMLCDGLPPKNSEGEVTIYEQEGTIRLTKTFNNNKPIYETTVKIANIEEKNITNDEYLDKLLSSEIDCKLLDTSKLNDADKEMLASLIDRKEKQERKEQQLDERTFRKNTLQKYPNFQYKEAYEACGGKKIYRVINENILDSIILPMNHKNSHWNTAEITKANDGADVSVTIYESLTGDGYPEAQRKDITKIAAGIYGAENANVKFQIKHPFRQQDGIQCGVYVALTYEILQEGQAKIPYYDTKEDAQNYKLSYFTITREQLQNWKEGDPQITIPHDALLTLRARHALQVLTKQRLDGNQLTNSKLINKGQQADYKNICGLTTINNGGVVSFDDAKNMLAALTTQEYANKFAKKFEDQIEQDEMMKQAAQQQQKLLEQQQPAQQQVASSDFKYDATNWNNSNHEHSKKKWLEEIKTKQLKTLNEVFQDGQQYKDSITGKDHQNGFDWWVFPSFHKFGTYPDLHCDIDTEEGKAKYEALRGDEVFCANYVTIAKRYLEACGWDCSTQKAKNGKNEDLVIAHPIRFYKLVQSLVGLTASEVKLADQPSINKLAGVDDNELKNLIQNVSKFAKASKQDRTKADFNQHYNQSFDKLEGIAAYTQMHQFFRDNWKKLKFGSDHLPQKITQTIDGQDVTMTTFNLQGQCKGFNELENGQKEDHKNNPFWHTNSTDGKSGPVIETAEQYLARFKMQMLELQRNGMDSDILLLQEFKGVTFTDDLESADKKKEDYSVLNAIKAMGYTVKCNGTAAIAYKTDKFKLSEKSEGLAGLIKSGAYNDKGENKNIFHCTKGQKQDDKEADPTNNIGAFAIDKAYSASNNIGPGVGVFLKPIIRGRDAKEFTVFSGHFKYPDQNKKDQLPNQKNVIKKLTKVGVTCGGDFNQPVSNLQSDNIAYTVQNGCTNINVAQGSDGKYKYQEQIYNLQDTGEYKNYDGFIAPADAVMVMKNCQGYNFEFPNGKKTEGLANLEVKEAHIKKIRFKKTLSDIKEEEVEDLEEGSRSDTFGARSTVQQQQLPAQKQQQQQKIQQQQQQLLAQQQQQQLLEQQQQASEAQKQQQQQQNQQATYPEDGLKFRGASKHNENDPDLSEIKKLGRKDSGVEEVSDKTSSISGADNTKDFEGFEELEDLNKMDSIQIPHRSNPVKTLRGITNNTGSTTTMRSIREYQTFSNQGFEQGYQGTNSEAPQNLRQQLVQSMQSSKQTNNLNQTFYDQKYQNYKQHQNQNYFNLNTQTQLTQQQLMENLILNTTYTIDIPGSSTKMQYMLLAIKKYVSGGQVRTSFKEVGGNWNLIDAAVRNQYEPERDPPSDISVNLLQIWEALKEKVCSASSEQEFFDFIQHASQRDIINSCTYPRQKVVNKDTNMDRTIIELKSMSKKETGENNTSWLSEFCKSCLTDTREKLYLDDSKSESNSKFSHNASKGLIAEDPMKNLMSDSFVKKLSEQMQQTQGVSLLNNPIFDELKRVKSKAGIKDLLFLNGYATHESINDNNYNNDNASFTLTISHREKQIGRSQVEFTRTDSGYDFKVISQQSFHR